MARTNSPVRNTPYSLRRSKRLNNSTTNVATASLPSTSTQATSLPQNTPTMDSQRAVTNLTTSTTNVAIASLPITTAQTTSLPQNTPTMDSQKDLKNANTPAAATSVSNHMQHMERLYLDIVTADVRFVVKTAGYRDENVWAHKILLVANSPVFHTMFFGSSPEIGAITISDVSRTAFKAFLKWFYFSNPGLAMEYIEGVVHLAHKYNVDACLTACSEYLIENFASNIIIAHDLATKYNLTDVKNKFNSAFHPSSGFYGSDEFLNLPRDKMEQIIQVPFISAKVKFDVCIKWSENACKRLKQDPKCMKYHKGLVGDSLEHINFNEMSAQEFHDCMRQSFGLFSYTKLHTLLVEYAKKQV